jgi:hypothetical protein
MSSTSNKGLPKKFRDDYGNPVLLKPITTESWDSYWQSDQGKTRLTRELKKEEKEKQRYENLRENALVNSNNIRANTPDEVKGWMATANAGKKEFEISRK